MAKQKNKGRVPEDGKCGGPVGKKSSWVRTGGAIGEDCMAKMEDWNADGAGVDEDETEVGSMPNEGIKLSPLNGRIR